MSYTINVRVIQTNPSNWYTIVEKTAWKFANGGYWTESDGLQTLTMGGSGTSGVLRFRNAEGKYFLVSLGIHNYQRWCDIVVDAASDTTGVVVNPEYYDGPRSDMLWKQLANLEKTTSQGAKIKVNYYKEDGNTKYATITIS